VYNERVEELNAATQERDDLKKHYDGLRKKRQAGGISIHSCPLYVFLAYKYLWDLLEWHFRLDEFMAGFNVISLKLKEMYQVNKMLFFPNFFHLCLVHGEDFILAFWIYLKLLGTNSKAIGI